MGKLMKMVEVRRIVDKYPQINKSRLIDKVCKKLKIHRREATMLIDETAEKNMISELEVERDGRPGRPERKFIVVPTYEETVRRTQNKRLDIERRGGMED